MNIIEVKKLNKFFPEGFLQKKRQVLKDINFSVEKNKSTGFIGLNGSGKTTTLKCLLNFIIPDQGEILFFGEKLSNQSKSKLGYLPERPYYHDFLTLKEFLRFHWNLSDLSSSNGKNFEERSKSVIASVGLSDATERKLKTFSKGMLQRAGLAQAIINDPELIILDEPMSGLDPDGRIMMKDLLLEQKNKGKSLFLSSHLLNDLEELCDNLVVIDQGRVLYQGGLKIWKQQFSIDAQQSMEEVFRNFRKLNP